MLTEIEKVLPSEIEKRSFEIIADCLLYTSDAADD